MDEWRFVSDSSCDLDPADWDYAGASFGTAPLTVTVDGVNYVDLPETNRDEMIEKMGKSRKSSSACPSIDSFVEEFRKAKNIICVAMTAKLSGTYNCAVRAREIALEEDPSKNIYVLDSHATSGVHVILLRELCRLHRLGLSFDEIVRKITEMRDGMHILFSLANFHNFIQNGRVSRATGAIATALRIRPIAENSPQGELVMLEKPRGLETMLGRMVQLAGEKKDLAGKDVVITYVDTPKDAEHLRDLLFAAFPAIRKIDVMPCRCLCSYYADRGGILLSF